MRLNFKTTMPFDKNRQTYFENKICNGIKKHTLRALTTKWRTGLGIEFTVGSRSKPQVFFRGTSSGCQIVKIIHLKMNSESESLLLLINNRWLLPEEISAFIKNDGFDNEKDFLDWFFPDRDRKTNQNDSALDLKIIHWTDLRY